jgi:hypothetical protein
MYGDYLHLMDEKSVSFEGIACRVSYNGGLCKYFYT